MAIDMYSNTPSQSCAARVNRRKVHQKDSGSPDRRAWDSARLDDRALPERHSRSPLHLPLLDLLSSVPKHAAQILLVRTLSSVSELSD